MPEEARRVFRAVRRHPACVDALLPIDGMLMVAFALAVVGYRERPRRRLRRAALRAGRLLMVPRSFVLRLLGEAEYVSR